MAEAFDMLRERLDGLTDDEFAWARRLDGPPGRTRHVDRGLRGTRPDPRTDHDARVARGARGRLQADVPRVRVRPGASSVAGARGARTAADALRALDQRQSTL